MANSLPDIVFKFYPVNQNGQITGLKRFDGKADVQGLALDSNFIPYADIYAVNVFDNRLVLQFNPQIAFEGKLAKHIRQGGYLVVQLSNAHSARTLKKRLDQLSTLEIAKQKRQQLEAQGKADTFNIVQCNHCKSTIDVSGFASTPLVYCPCCYSLQDQQGQIITDGDLYGICPESGLFDRIQTYTEFYFYFLLVIYGWRSQKKRMGDYWAGSKLFPKMLSINFLFIIGIIPSIMVKTKSSGGRNPLLKNLAKANKLAYQGKVRALNDFVDEFAGYYPNHPGIMLNVAKAAQKANNEQIMTDAVNKALNTCANYYPAILLLTKK